MRLAAIVAIALAAACGDPKPPASPSSAPTASTPPSATSEIAPAPEAEPEQKRQLPPVEVTNLCHDVAVLAYGEPPNMKADSLGRFAGDANGAAPRERDGTLPLALLDDKDNIVAKVHVSRHMKKVEIGRSCRTLYAH